MTRVAYVNGAYRPHAQAAVHVEDRGYQFADAVYEVWSVRGGALLDEEGHFARLSRSLGELSIAEPMPRAALKSVLLETARRNRVRDGIVYLQVSRGVAPRDHVFPTAPVRPSVVVTAKPVRVDALEAKATKGVGVITTPDIRWGRCDIKTVGLLANVLVKQQARAAGAGEAWMVDEGGFVTEGGSTNAWIVNADNALVTREATANILNGITRRAVMKVAQERQMRIEERAFTVAEAKAAKEAFITAATAMVTPVTHIDGDPVGDGTVGAVAKALRAAYIHDAVEVAHASA